MPSGADNQDQLVKIARVCGTDGLFDYMQKYGITLEGSFLQQIGKVVPWLGPSFTDVFLLSLSHFHSLSDPLSAQHARKPWKSFVNAQNKNLANDDAIDLLDNLLKYDHQERYAALASRIHRCLTNLPSG